MGSAVSAVSAVSVESWGGVSGGSGAGQPVRTPITARTGTAGGGESFIPPRYYDPSPSTTRRNCSRVSANGTDSLPPGVIRLRSNPTPSPSARAS